MIQEKIEKYNRAKCTGCHACKTSCPVDCISMETDAEGFWYPKVSEACINCEKCIKVCHIFKDNSIDNFPTAYACINQDEEIRMSSSSGGVFYALAKQVISEEGVAFGAAFNEKFELEHSYTETLEGIKKYQGSKYVQSKIGNCYAETKQFLQAGRQVLFSGTPCQIGGLKAYLRKEYNNLFCVDIICHGVPSPMVWGRYVKYQQQKNNANISRLTFRDKTEGWKNYNVKFDFKAKASVKEFFGDNIYMKVFLKDLCLRPSCYNCDFKTLNRQSDITLADFWGVQQVLPEMDDDKGTSLIFVNSHNGSERMAELSEGIKSQKVDVCSAIKYNPSAIKSVARPSKRESFLDAVVKKDFAEVVKEYTRISLQVRVVQLGRRFLSKTYRMLFK
ncbi:MAG: Coenzyme F420 hydrogenase/dehydrogenase, beta subunit C-terminal domain [Bacteroidales bacterium]